MSNYEKPIIKKTLQVDKIVSQDVFYNFSTQMNKSKIKVKKPTGIAYPIFASLALIMLILFLGVL